MNSFPASVSRIARAMRPGVTEIIVNDDGTARQIKVTLPPGVLRRFVRLPVTCVAP